VPTPQYTALATTTLGSTASSVTFSSISGSYRDLVLVINGGVTGNADFFVRLNSDTGNASGVYMYGNGSSAASFTEATPVWTMWTSGRIYNAIFQVMDYPATDKHKTILGRVNAAEGITVAGAVRWASTSAVTSLQVATGANAMTSGTTLSLYGVK
jgi:hypothetical protein